MDSESDSDDDEGGEGIGDPEEEQPWLEDPTSARKRLLFRKAIVNSSFSLCSY
jgi:hypothetical protein